jgi:hypothetical protein
MIVESGHAHQSEATTPAQTKLRLVLCVNGDHSSWIVCPQPAHHTARSTSVSQAFTLNTFRVFHVLLGNILFLDVCAFTSDRLLAANISPTARFPAQSNDDPFTDFMLVVFTKVSCLLVASPEY